MESEEEESPRSPGYQPLERPQTLVGQERIDPESSDDSPCDSDSCIPKRQRFTFTRSKKYNIWSDCTADDLLVSLDNFTMGNMEKNRSVESYPYIQPYFGPSTHTSNSTNYFNAELNLRRPKLRTKRRTAKTALNCAREKPRTLQDLQVDCRDTIEIIARDLAMKLGEPKYDLILNVVAVLGPEKSIELYYKTKDIESEGGLLVIDRSRKRTSGGVYFYLLRGDESISSNQKGLIFHADRREANYRKIQSLKRRRAIRRRESAQKGCAENSHVSNDAEPVLDNPPPSPATGAESIIIQPLNRHFSSSDTDSDQMDIY